MLSAEHRYANVGVAHFEHVPLDAVDFVTEHDADREAGLPIEEIHGMDAGFYGRNLIAALLQVLEGIGRARACGSTGRAHRSRAPFSSETCGAGVR